MGSPHTPLLEGELKRVLGNRVTLDFSGEKYIYYYREINDPIGLRGLSLRHGYNTYIKPLNFENCIFNNIVDIGDYDSAGTISFKNCVFNSSLSIESKNTKLDGKCEFNKQLKISVSESEEKFSNLLINDSLEINGSTNKLELNNISSDKKRETQKIIIESNCVSLVIDNVECNELKILSNDRLNRGLRLENVIANKLSIGGIDLNSSININNCQIKEIELWKIKGSSRHLNISNNCKIGLLNLPLQNFDKIDVSNVIVDQALLSNIHNEKSLLNIQNVTITNFIFSKVYNYGLITLRELFIPEGGCISIKSSNLGKTDFILCSFSNAYFEFENSKMTEVFLSETDFPKSIRLNEKMNPAQAQLAFGQLHSAFLKQGDNIRALEYQSREIEALYNSLSFLKRSFPFVSFNKINLGFNKLSNNFGRDWGRGIVFSIGVGITFFYLLVISTQEYHFGFPITFDEKLFFAFLKFINPLRFFDTENLFKVGDKDSFLHLSGASYLCDFLGRVFIAYGFYQTIQAFRRFGRK